MNDPIITKEMTYKQWDEKVASSGNWKDVKDKVYKQVTLTISSCEDCPYHKGGTLGTPTMCNLTDTMFVNINGKLIVPREWIETFPPDCPLENV